MVVIKVCIPRKWHIFKT